MIKPTSEAAPKMSVKEALGIFRHLMRHWVVPYNREWLYQKYWGAEEEAQAFAVLTDLAEECERLKQKWVDSMGDHVAVSVEAEELQARAEKAEAKLAELKDDLLDAQGDVASAKAQADSFAKIANEKEAELEKVRLDFANMIVSANELADKYETARPLIEAVGRMKTKQLSRAGVWFATREDKNTILRAALAYKKRSQPNE